jgi:protein TonB
MTKRLAALAVLVLAACAPSTDKRETPAPTPPPAAAAPAAPLPPVVSAPIPAYKPLGPLDEYKQRIANRIVAVNPQHVYAGEPPHLLKSVTVIVVVIDARGNVSGSRVLRGNGHTSLEQLALASIRRAAPFEAPPRQLLRNNVIEVTETWLFRDDGKFQIRSIAAPQPALPPEPDEPPKRRG